MKVNFQKCLKPVLVWEGGFVNHPKDPGGPTNKGITQRVYDAYRKNKGQKIQSVREITNAEVEAIYKAQYWDVVKGDQLPAGVDLAVFDYAVNSGCARAAKALQKVLGAEQDGQIGQITLAKANATDAAALVTLVCKERMNFVKKLKTWSTFGKGWKRRIMGDQEGAQDGDKGIIDIGVRMARGLPLPPLPKTEAGGKADPVDTKLTAEPEAGAAGVGAIGTTGFTLTDSIATIGQWAGLTKDQVQPLVDYSPLIKTVFIAMVVLSLLGGLAIFMKKRQTGAVQ